MNEQVKACYMGCLERVNHEIGKLMACHDTLKGIDGAADVADAVEAVINGHSDYACDIERTLLAGKVLDETLHETIMQG